MSKDNNDIWCQISYWVLNSFLSSSCNWTEGLETKLLIIHINFNVPTSLLDSSSSSSFVLSPPSPSLLVEQLTQTHQDPPAWYDHLLTMIDEGDLNPVLASLVIGQQRVFHHFCSLPIRLLLYENRQYLSKLGQQLKYEDQLPNI